MATIVAAEAYRASRNRRRHWAWVCRHRLPAHLGKEGLCRVLKNTLQRNSLPSVKKTLGKEFLCRVFSFTEGFLLGSQQRASLPNARKKTVGKTFGTRQRAEFR
jgi:hypothetical protein